MAEMVIGGGGAGDLPALLERAKQDHAEAKKTFDESMAALSKADASGDSSSGSPGKTLTVTVLEETSVSVRTVRVEPADAVLNGAASLSCTVGEKLTFALVGEEFGGLVFEGGKMTTALAAIATASAAGASEELANGGSAALEEAREDEVKKDDEEVVVEAEKEEEVVNEESEAVKDEEEGVKDEAEAEEEEKVEAEEVVKDEAGAEEEEKVEAEEVVKDEAEAEEEEKVEAEEEAGAEAEEEAQAENTEEEDRFEEALEQQEVGGVQESNAVVDEAAVAAAEVVAEEGLLQTEPSEPEEGAQSGESDAAADPSDGSFVHVDFSAVVIGSADQVQQKDGVAFTASLEHSASVGPVSDEEMFQLTQALEAAGRNVTETENRLQELEGMAKNASRNLRRKDGQRKKSALKANSAVKEPKEAGIFWKTALSLSTGAQRSFGVTMQCRNWIIFALAVGLIHKKGHILAV